MSPAAAERGRRVINRRDRSGPCVHAPAIVFMPTETVFAGPAPLPAGAGVNRTFPRAFSDNGRDPNSKLPPLNGETYLLKLAR